MAAQKINLLPRELAVSKEVAKYLGYAKNSAIAAVVVFSLVMAIGAGITYYFSNQLSNLLVEQDSLKTNISSLESTEQLLLVTKDRISKIQEVLSSRNNEEIFNKQKILLDNLPSQLALTASEIERGESLLEIEALNSRDLATFLNSLVSNDNFENAILKSLTFNKVTGYKVALEVN